MVNLSSNGQINDMLLINDKLIIAGLFTNVGFNSNDINTDITKSNNLAVLDVKDGVWSSLAYDFNDQVNSVVVLNNILICGGKFSDKLVAIDLESNTVKQVFSVSLNNVSRCNIKKLLLHNNKVYVCGLFDKVNNVVCNSVCVLEMNSNNELQVSNLPGLNINNNNPNSVVNDLVVQNVKDTEYLIIGGSFGIGSSIPLHLMARYNLSKSTFEGALYRNILMNAGLAGSLPVVNTLCLHNNLLYIGGYNFRVNINGANNYNVICVNNNTIQSVSNNGISGKINKIASINNNLFILGEFNKSQNNKLSINSLCIHQNNTLTNILSNNSIIKLNSIISFLDNSLLISGLFNSINNLVANNIAILNLSDKSISIKYDVVSVEKLTEKTVDNMSLHINDKITSIRLLNSTKLDPSLVLHDNSNLENTHDTTVSHVVVPEVPDSVSVPVVQDSVSVPVVPVVPESVSDTITVSVAVVKEVKEEMKEVNFNGYGVGEGSVLMTDKGEKRIEELISGDMVLGVEGYVRVVSNTRCLNSRLNVVNKGLYGCNNDLKIGKNNKIYVSDSKFTFIKYAAKQVDNMVMNSYLLTLERSGIILVNGVRVLM
jgi:hypothetical protein